MNELNQQILMLAGGVVLIILAAIIIGTAWDTLIYAIRKWVDVWYERESARIKAVYRERSDDARITAD